MLHTYIHTPSEYSFVAVHLCCVLECSLGSKGKCAVGAVHSVLLHGGVLALVQVEDLLRVTQSLTWRLQEKAISSPSAQLVLLQCCGAPDSVCFIAVVRWCA